MLTPQEVSTHSFSKASFGGYNMAMVDEFLDELTDDYTALYKENAALKAKLKVLVEKVEEYRATEDSMRATLLTAQRMADSIVKEAEQKRDQMMTQAEIDAKMKITRLKNETAANEERLRQSQAELEKFSAAIRAVCDKEIQLLAELPQRPVELPQEETEADSPVQEIEDHVMAAFKEMDTAEPAAETETPAAEPAEAPAEKAEPEPAPETGDPFADFPDLSATRQLNLDELKFGRNYNN
ncbi:MAG: DivIVA domain-containing protein [Clostridiales bacterium]|nr:DivIVA domain-containing protein [Clostridiales bacterium]